MRNRVDNCQKGVRNMDEVYIDPSLIPQSVFDEACSVLYSSIRAALSDPAVAAEFEQWKQGMCERR